MSTARCLLIYDQQPRIAATVTDHLAALCEMPNAEVFRLPILGDIPPKLDLDRFDWIIVHYTINVSNPFYMAAESRKRLAASSALKAVFVQDEYRHVFATLEALKELDCKVLFTCCPKPEMVYRGLEARFETVLTGYVADRLLNRASPTIMNRPIDIGYRGRELPYSLGRLGQEKKWIAGAVQPAATGRGYVTDFSLSERDRIYGAEWERWLTSCKTVLGTESGASVFDFDGSIAQRVNGCKTFDEASWLLHDEEGRIPLAQISPRCFEAAALGTPMILYEGEYSGILKPWRHYIPLRKDHGNMATVMDAVDSGPTLGAIACFARNDIAVSGRWSFRAHAERVSEVLHETRLPRVAEYDKREFAKAARPGFTRLRRQAARAMLAIRGAHVVLSAVDRVLPGRDFRRRLCGF